MRDRLKILFKTLLSEPIATLVWIAVCASVGFLGWKESIPSYLLILSIIAAAAFSLMFIKQFRSSLDKQRIQSNTWLETHIQDWLEETGHSILPKGEKSAGKIFELIAEDNRVDPQQLNPIKVKVSMSESEPGFLSFDVTLSMKHDEMGKWDDKTKGRWRRAIHINLLKLGVFFGDEITQEKDWIIYINTYLPRESISRLNIVDQATIVKRGGVLVRELLRQFVEEAEGCNQ